MIDIFEQEIEEVDRFIASLGGEGKELLAAIKASGVKVTEADPRVQHAAYYNSENNTYYMQRGLSLAMRFNFRVHEGLHAIQFNKSARIRDIQNDMTAALPLKAGKPCFDVETWLQLREVAETKAYAVQAYFNALAVEKTADTGFITCLEDTDNNLESLVELQKQARSDGLSPKETAQKIAAEFMDSVSVPPPEMAHLDFDTQRKALFIMSLGYMGVLDKLQGQKIPLSQCYKPTRQDWQGLIKAGPTLGIEQDLYDLTEKKPEMGTTNAEIAKIVKEQYFSPDRQP